MLRKWNKLPTDMQCPEVKEYYDILAKKRCSLFFKKVFDIMAGLILFIILAIPMLIIGILIKIDSKGPVFYRQERVTTYGKVFRIHKFRTMVIDADKIGSSVTIENDKRITKIGTKLRDLRLDEIPQLFDVLQGNMSFVGTRPESIKYVNAYTNEMKATLLLPAGITSMASILYKDESVLLDTEQDVDKIYVDKILPEKMKYNLNAIRNYRFANDISTMFKTAFAVLNKKHY